jgi:hypothetical protein
MSKAMNKTIRSHYIRPTVEMVLLAVLLLLLALVFVLQPAATTSDREGNSAIHTMSGTGGSSFTHDPYIERHAEVVAHFQQGSLR